MKMYKIPLSAFMAMALLFTQCSSSKRATLSGVPLGATITREGLINCFEPALASGGKPVWCEASAIVYDGNKVLLANDKDMPSTSTSVFYVPLVQNSIDTSQLSLYIQNDLLKKNSKYEDFARTPDSKYIFLSTAFDRVKPGSADWDNFNTVLYWNNSNESNPRVLTAAGHQSDSTSISLRPLLTAALSGSRFPQGPPYYKIEGLAATDKQLYFGIREEGNKFDDFSYKIKIVAVPYSIQDGTVQLTGAFTMVADMTVDSLKPGTETIAISSIEYDSFNKRFLILTSYENKGKIGGYLWAATENDLKNNRMYLVKDASGQPIHFNHKCEDLTIINKKRIIVIHDDDRETLPVNGVVRKPHQAAFSIVDFK